MRRDLSRWSADALRSARHNVWSGRHGPLSYDVADLEVELRRRGFLSVKELGDEIRRYADAAGKAMNGDGPVPAAPVWLRR